MRFGVCRGVEALEDIKTAAKAGFDYIETGFSGLSRCSEEEFEAFAAALKENDIKCEASNGFLPRDYKVVGEEFDEEKIAAYIEKGMERGAKVGLQVVVFGSGKARAVPDGMSFAEAYKQLVYFLGEVAAPIAARYGVTVVTEPLRKDESNIIHTIKEGVMLGAATGRENVGGLGDIYHMVGAGDTYDDVRELKGSLLHSHISNPNGNGVKNRTYPADAAEFDYKGFIDALEFAGCPRCSVEAGCDDFAREAPLAAKLLKSL